MALPARAAADVTLTVTSTAETSPTDCTLPDAITAANQNQDTNGCHAPSLGVYGNETINITATGTLNLTSPMSPINSTVDINGPGAGQFDIHRQSGGDYRTLSILGAGNAQLSGVTVSNGRITDSTLSGAGISNVGTLVLEDSVVRDNQILVSESGFNPAPGGGGVFNGGSMTVRRSTITNNLVSSFQTAPSGPNLADATGAGIYNNGNLLIERSTIDNNSVFAQVASDEPSAGSLAAGGGIVNHGPNATVAMSTISNNHTTATSPGAASETTRGGGVYNLGTITLQGDTIAFNTAESSTALSAQGTETVTSSILYGGADPNCDGSVNTNGGFNLEAGSTCPGLETALHSDPQLQALTDNGGPTRTHALGVSSPALDAGTSGGYFTDQRGAGFDRPFDFPAIANAADGSDIGALEAQDEDNDGINDDVDGCPSTAGEVAGGGCPIALGSVTIKYSKKKRRFKGAVSTPGFGCSAGRGVDLYRKQEGDDKLIRQTNSEPDSTWAIDKRGKPGARYYAMITDAFRQDVALCEEATSPTIKIPR